MLSGGIENKDVVDFSSVQHIKNVDFWSEDIDQYYHPSGYFGEESKKIVYSNNAVNETVFFSILLKEWFFILEKDGYLVIDYIPNKLLGYKDMERTLWWLWRQKYDLIYHGNACTSLKNIQSIKVAECLPIIEDQRFYRIVCKKTVSTVQYGDSIDKWTFGIVSNGEREDFVDLCIKSIRSQQIPEYEIIVCGKYHGREDENLKYIPFDMGDDRGWITKKKNLINSMASYQNICLMHDRYILSDNWFVQTRKYGNSFEYMTNPQYYDNIRAGDWVSLGGRKIAIHKIRLLDYKDWDKYIIISGGLIISKKNILQRVPFNEGLYWNDAEDVQLGHDMMDHGYIPRINNAKVQALSFRFGRLPYKPFGKKIYWPDMPFRRLMTIAAALVNFIPGMHTMLFNIAKKTGIYKIFYKM